MFSSGSRPVNATLLSLQDRRIKTKKSDEVNFSDFSFLNPQQKLRLIVEPGRIELPSKQAISVLSTCLVFVRFSMCN